jgi:hypothetical protein
MKGDSTTRGRDIDGCLTDTFFGKLLLKEVARNMSFEKDL